MASRIFTLKFIVVLLSSFGIARMALAADADITSDLVPPGVNVGGNFFTFTAMRALADPNPPTSFTVTKATMQEFAALNGQSVSLAALTFPGNSTNPPHTHPHSSELLFLFSGRLQVGFVDTTNKLFTQTLEAGDMFIFPKGLLHFQYNFDAKTPALAFSAFGSANPGTVSLPGSLFATNIDDNILAKSFKVDVNTIKLSKLALHPSKSLEK